MNGNRECFGTGRLLAVCGSSEKSAPLRLVQEVVAAVAAHVGAAEQSDDLTLLAVARLGPGGDAGGEVSLPAELERLPELLDRVRRAAGAAGLAEAQQSRLGLAVEEAWANVCHYAYPGRTPPGPVHCRIVVQPGELLVEIADEGLPFDPLARPDPDIDRDLDQRQPGGLGIFLIKQLTSDVAYRREDGRNVLAIRMGQ